MKRNLFLLVLLLWVIGGYAQQRTLSGTISDATTKEPLMSASVVVKGTTKGVSTDIDGKYTIEVSVGQTLEVSFMGYITQNVKVSINTPATLNIALADEQKKLEEVVVVGYGVTKKRDLAGAITSIKTDDVKAGVVADMSQMLKGRASGVQVRQNSLEPGGNVSIRVRGASSVVPTTNRYMW